MYKHIHIQKHHIGLLFHKGDLIEVLEAGSHHLFGRNREVVLRYKGRLQDERLEELLEFQPLRNMLQVVDLNDDQRALVWRSGRLQAMLGPGLHAWFNEPFPVEIQVFDADEFLFDHPRMDVVLSFPEASRYLYNTSVAAHNQTALFHDGELREILKPGRHVFWKKGTLVTYPVDLREQSLDVGGQEIMTADKVTLRLNLVLNYRVVDLKKAVLTVADGSQALYREAQLVLRAAVGTRNLDKLLAEKDAVGTEVAESLRVRADAMGFQVTSVGVRDIILPGEMKELLNRVTEAQKEAEANLIRRREETAAARSQSNTARLMSENPALVRMKELETLQEILKGAKTTFLFGAQDLNGQLRNLLTQET